MNALPYSLRTDFGLKKISLSKSCGFNPSSKQDGTRQGSARTKAPPTMVFEGGGGAGFQDIRNLNLWNI